VLGLRGSATIAAQDGKLNAEGEEKCPYHLPICEMIEEHLALFHTQKEAHGFV